MSVGPQCEKIKGSHTTGMCEIAAEIKVPPHARTMRTRGSDPGTERYHDSSDFRQREAL